MTATTFQDALGAFRDANPIDELLAAHRVCLAFQCATKGGEFHGPCPRCGGTDRLVVHPKHPCGWGRAWCRQCKRRGDALHWAMELEGCDLSQRGARARFLRDGGYLAPVTRSHRGNREPNRPNRPNPRAPARRIPWPAGFNPDPNRPNRPNRSVEPAPSPAPSLVDRALAMFHGQLVAESEAATILQWARSRAFPYCSCGGSSFWRLREKSAPWVCRRCHPPPAGASGFEEHTCEFNRIC